ncbi:DUF2138 domain-containing protein [Cupriavidus sp. YAF13]|uniref:DUF2138 domain-containing protein n=1 Tax=Cupriavidus sp. YAF13 TaxID=3233075 RepID=UPI003F913FD9
MKISRKKIALGTAALAIAAGVAVQMVWHPFGRAWKGQPRQLELDFSRPDALVDSESLSSLPRDMLRVPLLRDVLTEDFVNYYEDNEGRLSASGALRRIAFEHDLDWGDALLKRVFDEPGRLMAWRGADGTLRYWALSMERNGLAKVLQTLGTIAPADTQLSRAGEVGGTPLYALRIGPARSLLLAGKGDRLVVLSEAGMLLDAEGKPIGARAKAVAAWLSDDAGAREAPLQSFALDAAKGPPKGHRVLVGANYLSFGYQAFFPGIEALRFDFAGADSKSVSKADAGDAAWHSAVLVDGARLPGAWNTAELWKALPADPAACATLPVDWQAAGKMLQKVSGGKDELATQVAQAFEGPAAVCWYSKSALVAPLFMAWVKSADAATALRPVLASLFEQVIGAYEPKAGAEKGAYARLPVQNRQGAGGAVLWSRAVSSPYGTREGKGAPFAAQLSAGAYFPVTLALAGNTVLFSPDGALVDDALAVQGKRFPAVADTMQRGQQARTVLSFTPSTLAPLVRREATKALPADQEALFLNAARAHLFPKLKTLAAYPAVSLVLPDSLPSGRAWVPVTWQQAGTPPRGALAAAPSIAPMAPIAAAPQEAAQ